MRVERDSAWDLARDVIAERPQVLRPDDTRAEYATSVRMRSQRELLALVGKARLESVPGTAASTPVRSRSTAAASG
jgi:hypothetical protein